MEAGPVRVCQIEHDHAGSGKHRPPVERDDDLLTRLCIEGYLVADTGSNQVTIPALVLAESAFSFEVLRNGSFLSAARVGNKVTFNAQAGEQIIITFYRG
ncbi:MAG: hypothetical protein EOO77_34460, partial [Oxalobacteraceae bacterium]